MSDYENDPNRLPSYQESDACPDEAIQSIRNGIGGFLIAGLAIGRTLQVFSRVPGSVGRNLVLAWIVAAFVQGYYMYGHLQLHGRIDALPFELLIAVQTGWWFVGLVLTAGHRFHQTQPHNSDLGCGVLSLYFPQLSPITAGIVSDVAVGLALAGLLRLCASPILSNWYLVMVGWILICHFALILYQWYLGKRVQHAKRRSDGWRTEVRGRHSL